MSEWHKVKLGDICNFVKGEIGIAKGTAGEYPLVVTGKERKTCDSFQFDTKAVCIPLVSSAGHGKAALNYVHYQEGKFALGSILVAVIPQNENVINAQFLHLYLSRLKDLLLVPLMKGSANVSLSINAIKNIEISLPKIENQIEIVSLFNQIDLDHQELIKENIKQKTYLTKLRQAILQEAIEGKLTADWRKHNVETRLIASLQGDPNYDAAALLENIKAEKQKLITQGKIKKPVETRLIASLPPINPDDMPFTLPDGWVWCKLGEISNLITDGAHHTPQYIENGIPFLSVKNVAHGIIDFSNTRFISREVHCTLVKRCNPEFGDLLLTKVGTTGIAKVIDIKKEFSIFVSVALIKINQNLLFNYYLEQLINSPFVKAQSKAGTKGMGNQNLVINTIKEFVIPLPPLAEQHAIVERVDRLLATVNTLEQQVQARKTYAEQLMQAVLKEAFAG